MLSSSSSLDPYRDWLRSRLSEKVTHHDAESIIQAAVQRRGWQAMRVLGPRDVIAVLQDVYQRLAELEGEPQADKWLEDASNDLAALAERIPVPVATPQEVPPPKTPTPPPVKWGRRAHDLPLMLARVHSEIAVRSLGAIRRTPTLARLERAAEWDVQATQAEVRRWETEDMLLRLRADHSRLEVADQVAAARAQAELLTLTLQRLEEGPKLRTLTTLPTPPEENAAQLAHSRLMLTQTQAFLDAFAPLILEADADTPLSMLEIDLQSARFSLGIPLHPNVLRARHGYNFALWQTGDEQHPAVQEAQKALTQAEEEAAAQVQSTMNAARGHQQVLQQLAQHVEELERRALKLASLSDPVGLARVRLEWRQTRAAARIQANRMEEAVRLLEALISDGPLQEEKQTAEG